eukprot:1333865-Lingulodinium_polyedra.AAC.1
MANTDVCGSTVHAVCGPIDIRVFSCQTRPLQTWIWRDRRSWRFLPWCPCRLLRLRLAGSRDGKSTAA